MNETKKKKKKKAAMLSRVKQGRNAKGIIRPPASVID